MQNQPIGLPDSALLTLRGSGSLGFQAGIFLWSAALDYFYAKHVLCHSAGAFPIIKLQSYKLYNPRHGSLEVIPVLLNGAYPK